MKIAKNIQIYFDARFVEILSADLFHARDARQIFAKYALDKPSLTRKAAPLFVQNAIQQMHSSNHSLRI